jgi:hypothetical protein
MCEAPSMDVHSKHKLKNPIKSHKYMLVLCLLLQKCALGQSAHRSGVLFVSLSSPHNSYFVYLTSIWVAFAASSHLPTWYTLTPSE